jgi:hypothetical protein
MTSHVHRLQHLYRIHFRFLIPLVVPDIKTGQENLIRIASFCGYTAMEHCPRDTDYFRFSHISFLVDRTEHSPALAPPWITLVSMPLPADPDEDVCEAVFCVFREAQDSGWVMFADPSGHDVEQFAPIHSDVSSLIRSSAVFIDHLSLMSGFRGFDSRAFIRVEA